MRTFGGLAAIFFVAALASVLSGCGGGSTAGNPLAPTEDVSTSGAAASAVGGALSGSAAGGTLAFELPISGGLRSAETAPAAILDSMPTARSAASCPTALTSGTGCASSADSLWLTFGGCSYGSSSATFTGILEIISSRAVSCGRFPIPGLNGSLIRQYVANSLSTTPGLLTDTSAFGTVSTVDNSADGTLGNFDGASIPPIANGGYGSRTDFGANGARSAVTLAQHLKVGSTTDHSITGSVTITEAFGAGTRTVSGRVTVYHNLLRVIGTSTFADVVHQDGCCLPVSGTISTTFARGNAAPTSAGQKTVGGTETLTLNGCGTGVLQSYDGTTTNVSLSRCF